jgi:hypothetical protein
MDRPVRLERSLHPEPAHPPRTGTVGDTHGITRREPQDPGEVVTIVRLERWELEVVDECVRSRPSRRRIGRRAGWLHGRLS